MTDFLSSLQIQRRVLWALLLRESRIAFGTSHWGYLWAVLQPGVMLTFLIVIFVLIGRGAPFGESLALFFATSLLCLEFYTKMSASLMRAFSSNNSLFAYPPVQKIDAVLARFLLVASVYVIVWTAFHAGLIATGYGMLPSRPELVLLCFAAVALIGLGMGLVHAVMFSFMSSWQHVEKIFARPLFILSGTFYVPSMLPPEATAILKWNPILQAVELGRMGVYPNYHSAIFDPYYLCGFILVILTVGFFAERYSRKRRK